MNKVVKTRRMLLDIPMRTLADGTVLDLSDMDNVEVVVYTDVDGGEMSYAKTDAGWIDEDLYIFGELEVTYTEENLDYFFIGPRDEE